MNIVGGEDKGERPEVIFLPVVQAKLERSLVLQNSLRDAISKFLIEKQFSVEVQKESDVSHVLKLRMPAKPPVELSVIAGEIIHNLRSSLDLALFTYLQLVTPNFHELDGFAKRKIQFPIYDSRDEFEKGKWDGGLGYLQLRSDLSNLQGFIFAELLEDENQALNANRFHPLNQLRTLSNSDKHTGLLVCVAALDSLAIASGETTLIEVVDGFPWSDGSTIFRIRNADRSILSDSSISKSFTLALEPDSAPLNTYGIVEKLSSIHSQVVHCHAALWTWYEYRNKTGL
jgi:hypothetical protein